MPMIKLILHGCNGKMGQVVSESAAVDPDIKIIAGVDRFPEAKTNPYPVYEDLNAIPEKGDVILDFSSPVALPNLLDYAKKNSIPVVIATTGLSSQDLELIQQTSEEIAVFRAANMSVGVNLMYELAHRSASVLGDNFDIEILEKHHNQKVDSPSGTAYSLADAINKAFLNSKHYVFGRHSKTDKRSKGEIGIHAVRGGTIAGEHTVIFAGQDEVLEITHSAHSRQIFALGALTAVKYISDKKSGLYDMKDVMLDQDAVTNIYTSNEEAMITINQIDNEPYIIADIFGKLAQQNINIDMISQTAPVNGKVNISFTLPQQDLGNAIQIIGEYNTANPAVRTDVYADITTITVEGPGMERQSGVAAKVFEIMAKQNIRIKIITTSETKISYVIDQRDEKHAVEAIIEAFNLYE
jgi:4-hydroxy-tetrahydrodipicolinate reductase